MSQGRPKAKALATSPLFWLVLMPELKPRPISEAKTKTVAKTSPWWFVRVCPGWLSRTYRLTLGMNRLGLDAD
jgi:hypothetical protein